MFLSLFMLHINYFKKFYSLKTHFCYGYGPRTRPLHQTLKWDQFRIYEAYRTRKCDLMTSVDYFTFYFTEIMFVQTVKRES